MKSILQLFRRIAGSSVVIFPFYIHCKKKAVVCLSFLLLVFGAKATTYPANDYTSLVTAISASADGDIINITANIVVPAQVTVAKALTFRGNNYTISVPITGVTDAGIVIASASNFMVFNINASGKTVLFYNLIIKGGGTTGNGAGVSIAIGTTAKFTSCTISNSKAGAGGGLYNQGTCYLLKSHLTRNAADFGGGFLNAAGTMYIEYTDISENRSLDVAGGGGGCENNGNGVLYINNSTFSNNQSTELGGAVNNYNAYAYIANTSFTGNVAYGNFKGGAIAQNAGGITMELVNCLFGYNYYNNGSGTVAYTLDDVHAYDGTVNFNYCTFMALSAESGSFTFGVSNNLHALASDGSNNDIFTGGSLDKINDANGNLFGTYAIFRPFLINIAGARVPT